MTPTRLFDLPYYQLANTPQDGMFVTKVNGTWEKVSTREFIARVNACSKGLVGMGVEPGENVGLVSSNRYEWNIMDIAIQQIGAIVVPLYPNISESDYIYIFNDAKFKHCFVSNEELFEKINGIKDKTPDFKNLYTFDKVKDAEHWSSIEKHGTDIESKVIEDKMAAIKNGDLATIIIHQVPLEIRKVLCFLTTIYFLMPWHVKNLFPHLVLQKFYPFYLFVIFMSECYIICTSNWGARFILLNPWKRLVTILEKCNPMSSQQFHD